MAFLGLYLVIDFMVLMLFWRVVIKLITAKKPNLDETLTIICILIYAPIIIILLFLVSAMIIAGIDGMLGNGEWKISLPTACEIRPDYLSLLPFVN